MKNFRNLFSFSLALIMMLCIFIVGASAADADVWDGTATSNWYDSSATTLVIDSAEDLAAFVSAVNGGNVFSGQTVRLDCDIIWTAGDASEWSEITAPDRSWTPIGTSANKPFQGTFDGNGHTVSGLYYHGTITGAGFFGYVKGATIKNLHIKNSYFHAQTRVGGIVGSSAGGQLTITGCSVNSTYLLSNWATKDNHHVGGIGGYLDGGSTHPVTISNCAFSGNIISDDGVNVGGIAGTIKGSTVNVSTCMATGNFTARNRLGGIIGRSYSSLTISDCYANVNLVTWGTANQGGIIGGLRTTDTTSIPEMTILRCYYNGTNLHTTNDALGKFTSLATRLGSYEVDETTEKNPLGSISTSSTYYTDSTNDSTYFAQSGQAAVPTSVLKKGGLTEFLAQNSNFVKDLYGNVQLLALSCTHNCEDYAGEWKEDSTTGGQKAECLAPGCDEILTRDESFKILGVSIRYTDPSGIRFLTQVNKNDFFKELYTGDDSNYAYDGANVTFGTVIIPENLLAGELTVDTPSVLNIKAKKIYNSSSYSQTDDVFYYSAVVVNYPERIDTYGSDLMARSYMTYTDANGETVYVYTNTKKISFYEIASKIYAQTTTSAATKEGLNMILALGAVDDGFYDEGHNRVMLLENASETLFNEYAASLESQGFTKHTNYKYAGNSFGLYYNDDYVVTFYYTPKSIGKYTEDNQDWYVGGTSITDDMDTIANSVRVEDIENVMRVIIEKRSQTDLPQTGYENYLGYTRNTSVTNSIAYAFPNDNYNHYGMGYVIQLGDGSFLIIDGGNNVDDPRDDSTDTDSDYLYDYLMSKKPANHEKPVIAAWILTHIHGDHTNAMKNFISEYSESVELEQVIYNFMSGDTVVPTGNRDKERYAEVYIKTYFPNVRIVRAHTGYKFFIRNAEVNILYSIDDIIPESFEGMFANNESIAFDVIIDNTQRLMFTGEIFIPGSRALVNMYGASLKSDVVQISHHGNYGATLEVNQLIWPDDGTDYTTDSLKFALLPNGNNRQARNRLLLNENTPFIELLIGTGYDTLSELNINLASKKLYINGDLIFENGTVTSGYTTEQSDVNVVASGAIGMWKTIALYTSDVPDNDIIIDWPDGWN